MIENIRCSQTNEGVSRRWDAACSSTSMPWTLLCSLATSGQEIKSLPNKIGSRNIPTAMGTQCSAFEAQCSQCSTESSERNASDEGVQHLIHGHNKLCSSHEGFFPPCEAGYGSFIVSLQDKVSAVWTGKLCNRHLKIRSLALSDIGTSGGNVRVSFQFITFL